MFRKLKEKLEQEQSPGSTGTTQGDDPNHRSHQNIPSGIRSSSATNASSSFMTSCDLRPVDDYDYSNQSIVDDNTKCATPEGILISLETEDEASDVKSNTSKIVIQETPVIQSSSEKEESADGNETSDNEQPLVDLSTPHVDTSSLLEVCYKSFM